MNQNQTVENDDLQKAIDDITNTTNTDPVFSDPVATPSPMPEQSIEELNELTSPITPGSTPETPSIDPPQTPEPTALDPLSNPMPIPEPPAPEMPELNMADFPPQPPVTPPINDSPVPETPTIKSSNSTPEHNNPDMHKIKEAALRDLTPLLDHISMEPAQKFSIYRSMFEDLKDSSVLESAYKAASEIPDDTKRAEALLYLVESIDKM